MSEQPIIQAEKISVFHGRHKALDKLSFTVPEGAFVSVIGPNGAGKSTLFSAILGLTSVDEGRLLVFGEPACKAPKENIGYVQQLKTFDRSFPARTLDLVVSGLINRWPWRINPAQKEQALAALEKVDMLKHEKSALASLSGGELQRVYLARTFVSSPKLVLLDEPETGIDAVGESNLYKLLERYQEETGATILLITHDWNAVCHLCSSTILLNQKLIACGAPEQSLTDQNLRQAFGHVDHDHPMLFGMKELHHRGHHHD